MKLQSKFLFGFVIATVAVCSYVYILQPTAENPKALYEESSARKYLEWQMTHDPKTGKIPFNIRNLEQQFAQTIPTIEALARVNKTSRLQSQQWTARGPINRGGRTRALAYDVGNENHILAGGQTNGMWASNDGGANWKRTTSLSAHPSVTSVVQDKRQGKTNTWYYTSGEHESSARGGDASYDGDGVFKSVDGGNTWQVLPATAMGKPQEKYAFSHTWNIVTDNSKTDQDIVYVAAASSIQRSSDGGTTWSAVLESKGAEFTDVAITKTGELYATINGEKAGIYRSTNGIDWVVISPNDYPSTLKRMTIGMSASNEKILYFFGETPNSGKKKETGKAEWHSLYKYTYVSGDGSGAGGEWNNRSANIPNLGGKVGDYSSQESYDIFVSVKPDNPDAVFIGGTNLYRSTDGFATSTNTTWVAGYATSNDISQYAEHHPDLHSQTFLPSNPNVMLSGHDGGISRTTECMASEVKWNNISTGYLTSQFYAIAIERTLAGSKIIIGGLQDNGSYATQSDKFSEPWTSVGSGDGGFADIIDTNVFFYSSQNGEVGRTTNPNISPGSAEIAPPKGAEGMQFITPYILDAANTKIMYYLAGGSVWRANDAVTVTKESGWEKAVTVSDVTFTSLNTSVTPAHRLLLGTSTGKVFRVDDAHTGTPTAKDISGANFPSGAFVSCVAVDPTNADRIYAVFSNYNVLSIFATTDGGTSWSPISGNLEQNADGTGNGPSCRWLSVLPRDGKTVLFVGTSTGLYSTEAVNGMNTVWAQEGASIIGNVVVPMILSRPVDGMVVVATHASGVYSATYTSTSDVTSGKEQNQVSFIDNFPEPFINTTTIRYHLDKAQHVVMRVYDIQGREVQSLVNNSWQSDGEHDVAFSGSSLPNGRYLVNISAGSSNKTKLITLNR